MRPPSSVGVGGVGLGAARASVASGVEASAGAGAGASAEAAAGASAEAEAGASAEAEVGASLVLEWAGRERKIPLKKNELRSMVVGGK